MSSDLHNLSDLVGHTVVAVVVDESPDGMRRGFLVLADDSHVEVYVRHGGAADRAPGGVAEILDRAERDGCTIKGTWVAP